MSAREECPPRIKILALLDAGEDVPHLASCSDCAAFAEAARGAVAAFRDRQDAEAAFAEQLDAALEEVPSRRWSSVLVASREFHRSAFIRELLRRADSCFGPNPRLALDFTEAAIGICEAMRAAGNPPAGGLRIEALKDHAMLLSRTGQLTEALRTLDRGRAIASETGEDEVYHRAVLSLCTAIVYAEADLARFDEAIALAEEAAAVLDLCGDVVGHSWRDRRRRMSSRPRTASPMLFGSCAA